MAHILALFPLVFSLLLVSPQVFASSTFALELEAVRIQFDKDNNVQVSYAEPCGSEFAGFLYRGKEGGELQVAVVVRRFHARCMSLTGMRTMRLPLVKADRFAAVTSIKPSLEPQILKAVPMQNIHVLGAPHRGTVHAVYTSQCGQALGLLVQAQVDGLHFGVLESSTQKSSPAACQRTSKVYSLNRLDVNAIKTPHLLQIPSKSSTAPYLLRRIPLQVIKPNPSRKSQRHERYFHLSYQRSCNEAPIGLVRQQQGKNIVLSMLVAQYPEMECPTNSPRSILTKLNEDFIAAAGQNVTTIARPQVEDLRLVRPAAYRIEKGKNKSILAVKTYSACKRDLGLVSRSSKEGIAIGILQSATPEPCNSSFKKVSYDFVWDINSLARRDVKPLQLLGS